MEFGYFTLSDNHYADNTRSPNQFVADITAEALYADALGMHSAWIGEHHFSTLGVLSCSDLVLVKITRGGSPPVPSQSLTVPSSLTPMARRPWLSRSTPWTAFSLRPASVIHGPPPMVPMCTVPSLSPAASREPSPLNATLSTCALPTRSAVRGCLRCASVTRTDPSVKPRTIRRPSGAYRALFRAR